MTSPGSHPGLLQTMKSVLAAGFGVQSAKNRERDFTGGSPGRFVVAGLIGTAIFVLTMVLIVRMVLRLAGG
ncbi:MAG TPA: DUF2970 domain-containing protein [Gammaproteobacteria bacterium]|nr:DUF2970 domain-containing protein [Gammaproteobacteria bacterium]